MASSKFTIESNRFREFDRALENAIEGALERGADVGKAAALSKPTRGYNIQGIIAAVKVGRAREGRNGLEIDITWNDYRHIFFEKGTYASRSGKLKQARQSTSDQQGVKPVRFMRAAATAGRAKLLELIQQEMRFR